MVDITPGPPLPGPVAYAQVGEIATGGVGVSRPAWREVRVWCPACASLHPFRVQVFAGYIRPDGSTPPVWTWDGNLITPTFEPSMLVTYQVTDGPTYTCHSFLRNGMWQYLGDCTHALAGQTVPMVPLPDWFLSER